VSEVSCRAFAFFVAAERAGACRVDDLIAGLPVSRAQLEDPQGRVSWDVWARMTDRFGEICGSDEAIADSGKFAISDDFAGSLTRLAWLFSDHRLLYQVAMLWLAPVMYRAVRFSVTERWPSTLRVEAHLLPGFRPSRAWFVMVAGSIRLVPTFLGLPATECVVLEHDDRHTVVDVHVGPRTGSALWRRLTSPLRIGEIVARELVAQQTQLSRSFEEMRQATASFQNVLDAMPLAVAVVNDGRVRYANPALARLVDVPATDLTDEPLASLFHADDAAHARLLARGAATSMRRVRLRPVAGASATLEALALGGIPFERQDAVVVIGRDVTEEERARVRLARSDATVRLLLSTQPDLVVRLSRAMIVVDVQPGRDIAESTRLAAHLGDDLRDVLDAAPAPVRAALSSLLDTFVAEVSAGRVFERSAVVPDTTGRPRHLHFHGTPVADGDEIILVVRDETQRREVERRLEVAERMASLGVLTTGVAHEINNPLTYVALGVEDLKAEIAKLPPETSAKLGDLVAAIGDGTERIRGTVERMRHMSAPTGERKRIDPRHAVESALVFSAHETQHRARVVTSLEETPRVVLDETELSQVFTNLIVNAAHSLDRRPPGEAGHEIRVRLFAEGPAVVFECEDTGEGIAPDQLSRIFEPFFTTKERKQGTGLGLSIVHRTVKLLGGTIDVRSIPGEGSVFRVTLPSPDAPKTASVQPPSPGASELDQLPAARVFVVDDEPMISRLVTRALRGAEVVAFNRAEDALEALTDGASPDVVICDLMMPGMTGIDLYERVRQVRPGLEARFAFLTGGAFTERAQSFVKRPGLRVGTKPLTANALRRLVRDVLEEHGVV